MAHQLFAVVPFFFDAIPHPIKTWRCSMSRTSYLTTHHGSFWFQIRVPVAHQPRHGLRVRTNLQTNDPTVAKTLALRLAAEWLVRFSHEPEAPLDEHPLPAEIGQPPLPLVVAPPEPVAPALSRAAQAAPETSGLSPHVADMLACWRRFKIEPPCRLNFEPGLQASLRGPAVDKCSA